MRATGQGILLSTYFLIELGIVCIGALMCSNINEKDREEEFTKPVE